jgi:hypothetical protein
VREKTRPAVQTTKGVLGNPELLNFRFTEFSEDEMRRPTPQLRSTLMVCKHYVRALTPNRKEDRPTSDGSKGRPKITAGLDIGDSYSYPCASSTHKAVRL